MLAIRTQFCLCSTLKYYFGNAKTNSFYRRQIPQHLVIFASPEGKQLFRKGWDQGYCQAFFPWVQQFITQNDVSTCSSASMAMMLNTLKIDPGVNWKGIWRWYDQNNIQEMNPDSLVQGLTLEEYHNLTLLNKTRSMTFSPLQATLSVPNFPLKHASLTLFRSWVKTCTSLTDCLMTVNFCRKTIGQTGTGHYSPLVGYNSEHDMVLILDVAKFKYDSYWCSLPLMYESLKQIDKVSCQSRGFVVNRRLLDLPQTFESYQKKEGQLLNHIETDLSQIQFILRQKTLHHFVLPLLYDYYTCHLPQFDKLIAIVTQYLNPYDKHISELIARLDQQSLLLITSFIRTRREDVIKMLLLVISPQFIDSKNQTQESLGQLKGFIDLMRKYQLPNIRQ